MVEVADVQDYIKEAQAGDRQKLALLAEKFEPKVRKCLLQTTPQERDDLRQELMLKVIELTLSFDTRNVPTFEEFKDHLHANEPR
ncbi:DNA-directed RNA polymerase specialized sigma24 family protein [Geomicrobium halophilum]|uniref:DNA-directed RNA polymerase specialized sigma24 family protein n=1 Tax=Geomicrobium halophilum TaxID=549000 RepID=A0A841Q253_9BACL|nr:helix-turn-helix domain-containing protein [Geomicrobium halophilum]MBB6450268.1 DNA-directed RNA polymerase specialized sigma24 family protein [Geomicrobium halophilum]